MQNIVYATSEMSKRLDTNDQLQGLLPDFHFLIVFIGDVSRHQGNVYEFHLFEAEISAIKYDVTRNYSNKELLSSRYFRNVRVGVKKTFDNSYLLECVMDDVESC